MAAALFLVAAVPASACDTALVLLMDESASMSDAEFNIQRDGTAAAFTDPSLLRRINRGQSGYIYARVATFSIGLHWYSPWIKVQTEADAARFASEISNIVPRERWTTMAGHALSDAVAELDNLPEPCDREVIDLSTDGRTDDGMALSRARDIAISRGTIVNALMVHRLEDLSDRPQLQTTELIKWAEEYLITPITGFARPATFESYRLAIQAKLWMELASLDAIPTDPFRTPGQRNWPLPQLN